MDLINRYLNFFPLADDVNAVFYLIPSVFFMVLLGVVTLVINRNKGYKGGFLWGFLLGILGIIIVAVRKKHPDAESRIEIDSRKALGENEIEDIIDKIEAQSRQQKQSECEELLKKGKITEAEYRQRMEDL